MGLDLKSLGGLTGLIPTKVTIEGVEVDVAPLVQKLLNGGGITLEDLLPLVVAYFINKAASQVQKPAPPVPVPMPPIPPLPAPAPAPPIVIPAPKPAPGEPLANLKINPVWIQRNGVNDEKPNLDLVGWGNKVRFDANGADRNGQVRKDLKHAPIVWHWKWDSDTPNAVDGYAVGVYDQDGDFIELDSKSGPQVTAGSAEYIATEGADIVLKVHREAADSKRHQVQVWATAKVDTTEVKSNTLTMYVN